MQLSEMQGLLAGKCLPWDLKVNESIAAYLLRKLEDRNELERQLSAKTISEQNIINAFGISGEGAHSKLVIEYVHGLVAENAALKAFRPQPNGAAMMEALDVFFANEEYPEGAMSDAFEILCCKRVCTPATDAAIAEIGARPMDILAGVAETMLVKFSNAGVSHCPKAVGWRLVKRQAESEAANLRAGRKG